MYTFRHFLINLFFCLCLTMMLSWCCVTKNIEMSLLFLFVGAIPFLWILSPIDVTLYFKSLGTFDYIYKPSLLKVKACAVNEWLMYCIDELLNWQYEHRDHQQATKRNLTPRICIYFKTSTWKSLVNPWRALSTHFKTGRTEAKTFLASF